MAEFLNMSNVPSLGDTPSSLSPIAPDVLTPNISEDSTLNNQDECFHNTSCSQNNLAVDNETLKSMASFKDNGSCSGSDANAQVSENSQVIVYYLFLQVFLGYFKGVFGYRLF